MAPAKSDENLNDRYSKQCHDRESYELAARPLYVVIGEEPVHAQRLFVLAERAEIFAFLIKLLQFARTAEISQHLGFKLVLAGLGFHALVRAHLAFVRDLEQSTVYQRHGTDTNRGLSAAIEEGK